MNNYSTGAREALFWATAILRKCRILKEYEAAKNEVEDMMMQLASGTAPSFEKRTDFNEEL